MMMGDDEDNEKESFNHPPISSLLSSAEKTGKWEEGIMPATP